MGRAGNIMKRWLPLAVAVTGVCGLVYLAVQQELRRYADDPQIQLAEDAAYAIETGASVESQVPGDRIPIERSCAPFITVFDDRGEVLRSSGLLHGLLRGLPVGVLEYVRRHGEERVTIEEALAAHTAGSAYAEFQEDEKGTLAPGQLADLVILSRDILAIPPREIASARAEVTILGGSVVNG